MSEQSPSLAGWQLRHSMALAVVLCAGLALTFVLVRFTIDDAFITWRYGDTLVRHGVWTWDAWAPPVEAYTNPVYAALSIIPAALGFSVELFFKVFSALVAVSLTVWLLTRRALTPWHRVLLVALTVANPMFHIHLWSGLETPLYVTTLVIAFGSLTLSGRLGRLGLVAVFVLALTRPEGIALAGLAGLWHLHLNRSRRGMVAATSVVAFLVVYWVARAAYFGKFFPNTFYVKTADGPRSLQLLTLGFNLGVVVAVVLLAIGLAAAIRATSLPDAATRAFRLLWRGGEACAPVTPLALAVATGGLAVVLNRSSNLLMNYANRFEWQLVFPTALVLLLLPVTRRTVPWQVAAAMITIASMATVTNRPVVGWVLLGVTGAAALVLWSVSALPRWSPRSASAALVSATALILCCSFTGAPAVVGHATYRPRLQNSHVALATVLRDSPVTNRSLVVGDAGAIPLVSGWHCVDVYGLASTEVSEGRFTTESLAQAPPSVIIATGNAASQQNKGGGVPGMQTAIRFALDPDNGYTYLGAISMRSNYSLQLYVNRDVDQNTRDQLVALIERSAAQNTSTDEKFFANNLRNFPFLRTVR